MSRRRTLERVLSGQTDSSMKFEDVCTLLERMGFHSRTRGSHHIFWKEGIEELINLQTSGGNAKPYQVNQVRKVILKYGLDEVLR